MPRKREIRANTLCPFGLYPILHYNLALVAHLLGIQKSEYGKSYLQEANRLHGMVNTDLRSKRCSAGTTISSPSLSTMCVAKRHNDEGRFRHRRFGVCQRGPRGTATRGAGLRQSVCPPVVVKDRTTHVHACDYSCERPNCSCACLELLM
jgi:hypothetical protein